MRFEHPSHREQQPLRVEITCPVTRYPHRVQEDDTIIVLDPRPALQWPCVDCDDTHDYPLTVDVFDRLQAGGYRVFDALSGGSA